jgi:hypothetical protein
VLILKLFRRIQSSFDVLHRRNSATMAMKWMANSKRRSQQGKYKGKNANARAGPRPLETQAFGSPQDSFSISTTDDLFAPRAAKVGISRDIRNLRRHAASSRTRDGEGARPITECEEAGDNQNSVLPMNIFSVHSLRAEEPSTRSTIQTPLSSNSLGKRRDTIEGRVQTSRAAPHQQSFVQSGARDSDRQLQTRGFDAPFQASGFGGQFNENQRCSSRTTSPVASSHGGREYGSHNHSGFSFSRSENLDAQDRFSTQCFLGAERYCSPMVQVQNENHDFNHDTSSVPRDSANWPGENLCFEPPPNQSKTLPSFFKHNSGSSHGQSLEQAHEVEVETGSSLAPPSSFFSGSGSGCPGGIGSGDGGSGSEGGRNGANTLSYENQWTDEKSLSRGIEHGLHTSTTVLEHQWKHPQHQSHHESTDNFPDILRQSPPPSAPEFWQQRRESDGSKSGRPHGFFSPETTSDHLDPPLSLSPPRLHATSAPPLLVNHEEQALASTLFNASQPPPPSPPPLSQSRWKHSSQKSKVSERISRFSQGSSNLTLHQPEQQENLPWSSPQDSEDLYSAKKLPKKTSNQPSQQRVKEVLSIMNSNSSLSPQALLEHQDSVSSAGGNCKDDETGVSSLRTPEAPPLERAPNEKLSEDSLIGLAMSSWGLFDENSKKRKEIPRRSCGQVLSPKNEHAKKISLLVQGFGDTLEEEGQETSGVDDSLGFTMYEGPTDGEQDRQSSTWFTFGGASQIELSTEEKARSVDGSGGVNPVMSEIHGEATRPDSEDAEVSIVGGIENEKLLEPSPQFELKQNEQKLFSCTSSIPVFEPALQPELNQNEKELPSSGLPPSRSELPCTELLSAISSEDTTMTSTSFSTTPILSTPSDSLDSLAKTQSALSLPVNIATNYPSLNVPNGEGAFTKKSLEAAAANSTPSSFTESIEPLHRTPNTTGTQRHSSFASDSCSSSISNIACSSTSPLQEPLQVVDKLPASVPFQVPSLTEARKRVKAAMLTSDSPKGSDLQEGTFSPKIDETQLQVEVLSPTKMQSGSNMTAEKEEHQRLNYVKPRVFSDSPVGSPSQISGTSKDSAENSLDSTGIAALKTSLSADTNVVALPNLLDELKSSPILDSGSSDSTNDENSSHNNQNKTRCRTPEEFRFDTRLAVELQRNLEVSYFLSCFIDLI